jgi:hypothetical protein
MPTCPRCGVTYSHQPTCPICDPFRERGGTEPPGEQYPGEQAVPTCRKCGTIYSNRPTCPVCAGIREPGEGRELPSALPGAVAPGERQTVRPGEELAILRKQIDVRKSGGTNNPSWTLRLNPIYRFALLFGLYFVCLSILALASLVSIGLAQLLGGVLHTIWFLLVGTALALLALAAVLNLTKDFVSRHLNYVVTLDEKGLVLDGQYLVLWYEVRWYRLADELELGVARGGSEVVRAVRYKGLDCSPSQLLDFLAHLCPRATHVA